MIYIPVKTCRQIVFRTDREILRIICVVVVVAAAGVVAAVVVVVAVNVVRRSFT